MYNVWPEIKIEVFQKILDVYLARSPFGAHALCWWGFCLNGGSNVKKVIKSILKVFFATYITKLYHSAAGDFAELDKSKNVAHTQF